MKKALKQSTKVKKQLLKLKKEYAANLRKAANIVDKEIAEIEKQLACDHPKFKTRERCSRSLAWKEEVCTKCKFVVYLGGSDE